MRMTSKFTTCLLAAASVCSLTAAEILVIKSPADFTYPKAAVAGENDSFSIKGNKTLYSKATLKLDPAKKYKLSGEFRLEEGAASGLIYFGYVPYDKKGKMIPPSAVNVTLKSDTVVAKAAKKGDKMIVVKDASKWNMKTPYGVVAFNTREDRSDLPNSDVAGVAKNGINRNGDVWEITLNKPLTKDIAEGTNVRQQVSGGTFIYNVKTARANSEWTARSGILSGEVTPYGLYANKLWRGTEKVKVLLMVLGSKPDAVVECRNIKLEEVQ